MLDRIASNPQAFASGCLIWIPVAIWIVSLVHWMIMGDIDVGSGILGVCIAFALGFLGLNPPNPDLAPVFFLAALGTVILAPITRASMNRSQLTALEVEAIGRAYELLATKPDNMGAKFRLARSLYNKGIRAHAIAIGEDALKIAPERMFPEEFRLLKQWKEREVGHKDTHERIRCFECGIPNFPGTIFCSHCGAPYLLDYAQGRWMKSKTVKRVIVTWIFAMLCLVGIPTSALSLPKFLAIPLIVLLMALGIVLLVSAFRETESQKP